MFLVGEMFMQLLKFEFALQKNTNVTILTKQKKKHRFFRMELKIPSQIISFLLSFRYTIRLEI